MFDNFPRFPKIIRENERINTFFVGNDCRRIGSPWDVAMSADYANRSVTVKLHPLRDTNVGLSKLGETRACADYETGVLDYSVANRLFVSSGMKRVFYTLHKHKITHCIRNVENLLRFHGYVLRKILRKTVFNLLSKNTRYFLLAFTVIVINIIFKHLIKFLIVIKKTLTSFFY